MGLSLFQLGSVIGVLRMGKPLDHYLKQQKSAFLSNPMPDLQSRLADLKKILELVQSHQSEICAAIGKDFGQRSATETALLEVFTSVEGIKYTRKHLSRWMKVQKRHTSMWFKPAKNRLLPQPVGVVGIIVPWNYPLFLAIAPLVAAIAAGNRVMVKMSENSQHLCQLLQGLFAQSFNEDKICFIAEEGETGKAFSQLALDHLVFTGSSTTGKAVMANAAKNLVPVTLELGGKSPAIVADDYDLVKAMQRILGGKAYNSGQTCVAPDYLYVPEHCLNEVIQHAKKVMSKRFTDIQHPDYTSIIDDTAFARLVDTLEDAKAKGAEIHNLIPNAEPDDKNRKFPLHLVTNVNETMLVMQREIFGPILPIKTYQSIDEVVAEINAGERPLALYLFTNNKALQQTVIDQTRSGGVTINDVMLHVAQDDLPFGGVGNSGIGHYHGREGFERLSKMRPVMYQGSVSSLKLLYSPYSSIGKRMINYIINRKLGKYQ